MRAAASSIEVHNSYEVPYGGTGASSGGLPAHEDVGEIVRAVFDAAAVGGLTKMITLLESHADAIDWSSALCNEDGDTLLHVAVNGSHRDTLQYLLGCECGVQVDMRNSSGWTSLMSAIDAGDTRMAKILIDAGADVNMLWIESYSCLSCAVVLCAQQPENPARLEMIRLLITSSADINARHAVTGQTPLHVAAMFECIDAMIILIEHGADISTTDANDCTIVDFAAANGMLSILQWLEEQGIMYQDFERESLEKRTPLTRAATGGFIDSVRFLIHCQDERWRRSNGRAATNKHEQADPEAASELIITYRSQALYWALQAGHYDIMVFLCENGAQASRIGAGVGYSHTTALHIAAKYGRVNLADFLIENQGADVNYRNQRGRAPLHTAAIEGHLDMVELLLVHGAEIDAVSQSRISFMANEKADMKTPLQFAIWHGHYEVAALLLQHGASIHAPIILAADDLETIKHSGYDTHEDRDRFLALLKECRAVQTCA